MANTPSPRISVILPVRNGEAHLSAALESMRAQTESDWELVAIDDGSTDRTPEILAAASGADRRIRILTTPARGLVPALNLGLAQARAPLIARLDADDVAFPNRLQAQGECLERQPEIGLVSCLVDFLDPTGRAGGYQRHVAWLNSVQSSEAIRRQRFVESPLAHPSVAFRARLVSEHGGYREGDFPEDYELWLRWLDAGVIMTKLPELLLAWRDSPTRLSRTSPRYSVEAFYQTKARYLAAWLGRMLPPERPVWIWGAGRITRKRAHWLLEQGLRLAGWIDIDPRKVGRRHAGQTVHSPERLLQGPRPFVLGYVASWDAREFITGWLNQHGFAEETDYLLCA